jgi:hypothetical protein
MTPRFLPPLRVVALCGKPLVEVMQHAVLVEGVAMVAYDVAENLKLEAMAEYRASLPAPPALARVNATQITCMVTRDVSARVPQEIEL